MRLHRLVAPTLSAILTLLPLVAAAQEKPARVTPTPEQWRRTVERLEPAAFISIRVQGGKPQKGTVVSVGEDRFIFQPRTRIHVSPIEVRYADVVALERTKQGMSPGAKVLAGTGGVVGGLFVIGALIVASAY